MFIVSMRTCPYQLTKCSNFSKKPTNLKISPNHCFWGWGQWGPRSCSPQGPPLNQSPHTQWEDHPSSSVSTVLGPSPPLGRQLMTEYVSSLRRVTALQWEAWSRGAQNE